MANNDRLTGPVQESVITLLLFDQHYGAQAAAVLKPAHFDLSYRELATAVLDFRREYKKPPGEAHLDDIFDHVLGDTKHPQYKLYKNILRSVVEQAPHLNAEYLSKRVNDFARKQSLKAATIKAGERITEGGANVVPDLEKIFYDALRVKNADLQIGTFLGDRRNISRVINRKPVDFLLDIKELDQRGFGLTRGEIMLFQGVTGKGKTWFLTHAGKAALMQHAKVAHVTLEMPEDQITERYLRTLFALGRRKEQFTRIRFERDELGKLTNFREIAGETKRFLHDPKIRPHLDLKYDQFGDMMNNLVVKNFPSGSLTIPMLDAWLDSLELEQFYPDVFLLDYPALMDHPISHLRESLGKTTVDLRGRCQARNMAGGFPVQSNRTGAQSKTVSDTNVAEDWSQGFTTDMSMSFSQTKQEKSLNLARLTVDKNRNDIDNFTVLISQNYAQGQFCVDSIIMEPNRYWDKLKAAAGEDE